MPFVDVPLGPWRPDQGDLQHDGMAEAKNVYPQPNGYSLHPKADEVSTSTIDAIARGGVSTLDGSSDVNLFVGNATKLYQRTGTTFSDVSKSGGYSTASTSFWNFAVFEDKVFACNLDDDLQVFDLDDDTVFRDAQAGLNDKYVIEFDGTDDAYRSGGTTNFADAKTGTFSCWFRIDRDYNTGSSQYIFSINETSGTASRVFSVALSSLNNFVLYGENASGTTILNVGFASVFGATNPDDDVHHIAFAWDMADSSKFKAYLDGERVDISLVGQTYTNDTINYTDANFTIGAVESGVGGGSFSSFFDGAIGELFFTEEYVDLDVIENRNKFYRLSTSGPGSLGSDGSLVTGTQPPVYLSGDRASFVTNKGDSDDLTANGSPASETLLEFIQDAPKSTCAARVGDFLLLGNIVDTTFGTAPYRVRWSAIGDPEYFPNIGTNEAQDAQSDSEALDLDFGQVQDIAGGKDFGLVFQETAITRFSYIGGTAIFEVDTFEKQRGLIAPRAFAQVGNSTYFISQGGAFVTDGVNVTPIGDGVIDQTLVDDIDRSNLNYMTTAVDLDKKLVYFAIPGSTGSDKVYIYHYIENRWSYGVWTDLIGDASAEVGAIVQGYTLDTNKTPRVWVLGGYNEGAGVLHKLREFDGDFAPFELRTAVQEMPQMVLMDGASVYGDSNTTFAPSTAMPFKVYASESTSIGISDGESGTHTVTTTGAPNARTGKVDFRITGRVASFALSAASAITGVTKQIVQKFRIYFQTAGDA